MRLDRFLANSGLGTRKEVKNYIKKGYIKVNDQIIKSDSFDIDEYQDEIYYLDEIIEYHKFYYVLLNKPQGYVSATNDNVYPPVTDLVSEYSFANLFPVGRLDVDTTGTLLLTNDGTLCHQLLSPKYHVDKKYFVTTDYPIKKEMVEAFKKGILLDGELTLPGNLEIIDETHAYLTIHQGKFHQVKRMFSYFGLMVISLDRTEFAFLNCNNLERGQYRLLTKDEIKELQLLVQK